MAIAIPPEEVKKEGLLEINTNQFYFEKMRPFLNDILLKCKTDGELIRTIEKVINAADSFCVKEDYINFMASFDVLEKSITDKNYFNGPMKKGTEEEKTMVRDLIQKISDLRLIVACEKPSDPKEVKTKDRLNYDTSPIGENKDYAKHNMKTLNQPNPKQRIPNR